MSATLAFLEASLVRFAFLRSIDSAAAIADARRDLDAVRLTMVTEAAAASGFALTGDRSYLAEAGPPGAFSAAVRSADAQLRRAGAPEAVAPLRAAADAHAAWVKIVAARLLAFPLRRPNRPAYELGITLRATFDRNWREAAVVLDEREHAAQEHAAFQLSFVLGVISFGALVLATPLVIALALGRRYFAERRISDRLARAFGASRLPMLPTVAFDGIYVPGDVRRRVGGDWYDARVLPDRRVLITIGDVTGHGVEAAVKTARLRRLMLAAAVQDDDPASVLTRVNDEQVREADEIAAALCAFYDPALARFTYAVAGLPPPLLRTNAAAHFLPYGDPPLGVIAGTVYERRSVDVAPGSVLVLYTDGAIEQGHDDIAGERAFAAAALAVEPGPDYARELYAALFPTERPTDDVAILAIIARPAVSEP